MTGWDCELGSSPSRYSGKETGKWFCDCGLDQKWYDQWNIMIDSSTGVSFA